MLSCHLLITSVKFTRKMSLKLSKHHNRHVCEVKETDPSFPPLPPFASFFQKLYRKFQKYTTLEVNSARSKRFFRNKSSMISEQKRHIHGKFSYILHPLSYFNRIREMLFILLWTYEMIIVPVNASFGTTYIRHKHWPMLEKKRPDEVYLILPLQIFSMILLVFTGYIESNTKTIVVNQSLIMNRYLKTYFLIDLLTVMPTPHREKSSTSLYFFHCVCVFRIGTVLQYLKSFILDFKVKEEIYTCAALAVLTIYIMNIFTCIFVMVPTIMYFGLDKWPDKSWMVTANIEPTNPEVTLHVAYLQCLLCIVCHFFGAGHGIYDFNDVPSENLVLSIVMITGRLWTLFIIANLLRIFNVVTISESKYEEYLLQIEVFMRQMKLPKNLRTRLVQYYSYKYQNHFFNEQAIFGTLSTYLRQELIIFAARSLISKVELFRFIPKNIIADMIDRAKISIYLPNDVIAQYGESVHSIHFISAGTVSCYTKQYIEVAHIEDGDQMGLIAGLPKVQQSSGRRFQFYYVAMEPTEIYSIPMKEFITTLTDNPDMLKYFQRKVYERINDFHKREMQIKFQAYDLLSELSNGRILEKPRYRTLHYEP